MIRNTGKWDVRCPQAMCDIFKKRTGWYYKVNHKKALRVLKILAEAYDIPAPRITRIGPNTGNLVAWYIRPNIVGLFPRAHLKTVWHEFYHHLDYCTNGKYNSNDKRGGPSSLAWQFADRMWEKFRNTPAEKEG